MGMSCLNSLAARTVHAMHTVRPRCSDPLARVHADVQDLMRRSLLQHKALLEQNQAMLDQDMALLEAAMQEVLLEAAMQQVLLDPAPGRGHGAGALHPQRPDHGPRAPGRPGRPFEALREARCGV